MNRIMFIVLLSAMTSSFSSSVSAEVSYDGPRYKAEKKFAQAAKTCTNNKAVLQNLLNTAAEVAKRECATSEQDVLALYAELQSCYSQNTAELRSEVTAAANDMYYLYKKHVNDGCR